MANRGLMLFRKETTTRVDHGPCATCPEPILKGQKLVTLYEFNPATKQTGRKWKRHAWCPQVDIEYTRLSDKAGKQQIET